MKETCRFSHLAKRIRRLATVVLALSVGSSLPGPTLYATETETGEGAIASAAVKVRVMTDKNLVSPVFSAVSKKEFDDVIDDLLIAIAEQNFRITEHAQIGRGIAQRMEAEQEDTGPKTILPATVLHFCNLDYARLLLEVAPDYLTRMPCRIAITERINDKNEPEVLLEAVLLPESDMRTRKLARKINAILTTIVEQGGN